MAKKKSEFQAWPKTMTVEQYADMPLEQLKAAAVGCETCPVNMLCMTSGSAADEEGLNKCADCGCVGVPMSKKDDKEKHLLVVDCNKHQFKIAREVKPCELCDGRAMKYAPLQSPTHAVRHILPTQYGSIPFETRQKKFVEAREFWTDQVRQRDAAVEAERLKREAAAKKEATK
jgi:hypothetical protein